MVTTEHGGVAWIAFLTIVRKEIARFSRIWVQTILPPAITMGLYFVIFGHLIGARIGTMAGLRYIDFIAPGIVMMAIITNAYANVVSSFFGAKFQHHIEEILVSPTPHAVILAGYVTGGVCRGLCVGALVTVVALYFTDVRLHAPGVTLASVILTSTLFSLCGFINAIFARKFDDISLVPTFILTPLTYFGGVFYSIELLPPPWRELSLLNPILYMVEAFRFGIVGASDIGIATALAVTATLVALATALSMWLLARGTGLRT